MGLDDSDLENMPKNIIGFKRTSSAAELAEIYSSADVFVNPTLEDNFPTTNLESLACGTPVITFDTGGSSESVDDLTGRVIEQGNLEQLLEAIYNITTENNNYFENCILKSKQYNKNSKFDEYIELYRNIYQEQKKEVKLYE